MRIILFCLGSHSLDQHYAWVLGRAVQSMIAEIRLDKIRNDNIRESWVSPIAEKMVENRLN